MTWRRPALLLLLLPAVLGAGCGARLVAHGVAVPATLECDAGDLACAKAMRAFDRPGGLVVNRRARYAVDVTPRADLGAHVVAAPRRALEGVDHAGLLVLDYRRQPFADAKLTVTLDAQQTLRSVGIEGEPGSVRLVESLGAAADARREIREAQEEADAAREKARAR